VLICCILAHITIIYLKWKKNQVMPIVGEYDDEAFEQEKDASIQYESQESKSPHPKKKSSPKAEESNTNQHETE